MSADLETFAAVQKRYRHGNSQFPILYERNGMRVFENPCGEIFVENIESEATMRINSNRHGLRFTTDQCVEPVLVGNMIGWQIGGPR